MLKRCFSSQNIWTIQLFVVPLVYQRGKGGATPTSADNPKRFYKIMATTITKTATSKSGNKVTVTVTCGWDSVTTHERVDGFEFDRTKRDLAYDTTATFEINRHRIENAGIQDFNDTKKAYVTKELKKRNQLPEGREVAGEVWSKTDNRKRLILMADTYADVIEAYNTALAAAKAEAEQDPGYQEYLAQSKKREDFAEYYERESNKVTKAMELGEDMD